MADLTLGVARSPLPSRQVAGRTGVIWLRIQNSGNISAAGPAEFDLVLSKDTAVGGGDDYALVKRIARVVVPAGRSRVIALSYRIPKAWATGSCNLIATITPGPALADANLSDKTTEAAITVG
jgi:hypothetical protein